jgi:hypothetical protein
VTQPAIYSQQTTLSSVNPTDHPEVWDVVLFGPLKSLVRSPGHCTWDGWKRKTEYQKKKGKGVRGSVTTLVQQPECEGSFTFFFNYYGVDGSTPQSQCAQWDLFAASLARAFQTGPISATSPPPQPLPIVHPALWTLSPPVTAVYVTEVGPVVPVGRDGMVSVTVKMSEFFPAQPTDIVSTGTGAQNPSGQPNTPGIQPSSAQEVLDNQNLALAAKAATQAWSPPQP